MEQKISFLVSQALEGSSNFEYLETLVRDTSIHIGAGILEAMMNADNSDCHPTLIHPDGTIMNYSGRREKTFVTVLEDITLKRAYYTDENGLGYYPRDDNLGLDKDSLSPGVKRMIGHTASILSIKESSVMIEHLAGHHVSFKQVERSAEDLGEEIAQDEMTIVQNGNSCSRTMYLGVDGTGCPMRKEETIGRKGKQKDGSSKTREVKLAVIFSTDTRDKNGKPVRDEGSVTYNAAIESAATGDLDQDISEFACRVERETLVAGIR